MKTQNHKNLIILVLLMFVGQVVSAPLLNCSSAQMDSHSMSMMDMSSHDMSDMLESNQAMDCCDSDCECPSGMCVSIALYFSSSTEANFSNDSNQIDISSQKVNKQAISSIYRPPIFC